MRKLVSVILVLVFTLTSASVPATAAVKLGDACKSAGQTTNVNGSVLTCTKSGAKLLWSQGVKEQGYDTAFAKSHLLEAQAKANTILANAKYIAQQISSAPYCVTSNSSASVYIGGDASTGLRALI